MRRYLSAATIVAATICAGAARADEPAPETRWYGLQTMAADAVSTTLFLLGPQDVIIKGSERPAFIALGLAGYFALPPLIHWAGHDRPGAALASLGLRVGVPLAGALVGGLIGTAVAGKGSADADIPPGVAGAAFGLIVGAPVAMTLDWTLLSREPVAPSRFSVAPIYQPTTHARGLALQLKF